MKPPALVLLVSLVVVAVIGCAAAGLLEAEKHSDAGLDLLEQELFDKAVSEFDEAIRLAPEYAAAYAGRGNANAGLGEHEKAIEDFDEAIRLDPQITYAYVGRALVYASLGKAYEARQDAARAVELGSDRGLLDAVERLIDDSGNQQ